MGNRGIDDKPIFLTNRYIKGYYSTMPIFQQIKYTAYHKVIILQITFSLKQNMPPVTRLKKVM